MSRFLEISHAVGNGMPVRDCDRTDGTQSGPWNTDVCEATAVAAEQP